MRRNAITAATLLTLALACAVAVSGQSSTTTATQPDILTIPAGEHLVLELDDTLSSRRNRKGDRVDFSTLNETLVGHRVAIPRGTTVQAVLTKVKRAGRAGRAGKIRISFDELILPDGTVVPLGARLTRAGFTQPKQGKEGSTVKGEGGLGGRDAVGVAVLAGQGALIGAGVGGKKGAAYGSAVGAGIGLIQILMRRGPELDLPRGMLFELELEEALEIPAAAAVQLAQSIPPAARPSAPAARPSRSTGGFRFPDDPRDTPDEVPIPDFEDGEEKESETAAEESTESTETTGSAESSESTESVANRTPPPPAAAPAESEEADLPPGLPPPPVESGDGYRLRVDVRLVMVDAVVQNHRGQALDDLTREDFRLFEDGIEQSIRLFSRAELPLAVALVVDQSGSVAPYVRELRRAAYDVLSELKPGDQVALFGFASDVERLEDLTTDRRRIAERIARIRPAGGTNITDAVYAAAFYLGATAPDKRRAVVLISDNQETVDGAIGQGGAIRMALETETVVYSVKTPGENPSRRGGLIPIPNWMGGTSVRKIARETGGEVIDVDRVGSVGAALAAVIGRLKTRYTLGYQSTNKLMDGGFRQIKVELIGRHGRVDSDYSVFARRGYYAPNQVAAQANPYEAQQRLPH